MVLPLRKVSRVFVQRVVTAENIDDCQEDFVRRVVYVYADPADSFVAATEVDFVEDL
jgi:hypothetical protein